MAKQEIGDVTKRFAEAYNRGDIAAAVEFYTVDAKFLHPNTEIISGKRATLESSLRLAGRLVCAG
jgi:ketosteroid isomerase-like protein